MGVATYHAAGGLSAIWPLGPATMISRVVEKGPSRDLVKNQGPPELGDDYFEKPNMPPADGIHVKYGLGGDLKWILKVQGGKLDGLVLRFEPEGFLKSEDSGIFCKGRKV